MPCSSSSANTNSRNSTSSAISSTYGSFAEAFTGRSRTTTSSKKFFAPAAKAPASFTFLGITTSSSPHFFGHFGAVEIMPRDIHTTADGRRLLVIHGHELDTVVQNIKWLAYVGDVGYQLLLKLNAPVNTCRRWLGLGYWSLSAYVKKSVKNAVSFIGAFEKAIVQYAQRDHVDGVVCGHIHTPAIRTIETTTYYNSGDWVESLSALVEDFDGHIELITNFAVDATGQPTTASVEREEATADPAKPLPASVPLS